MRSVFVHTGLTVIFCLLSAFSSLGQLSIEKIISEKNIFSTHTSDDGLIFYLIEDQEIVYRNTKYKIHLMLFDGYKSRKVKEIYHRSQVNDAELTPIRNSQILITINRVSFYVYDYKRNTLTELPTSKANSTRHAQVVDSTVYYVTQEEQGHCYFHLEGKLPTPLFCTDNVRQFTIATEEFFLTSKVVRNKLESKALLYDKFIIYNKKGNKIDSISLEDVNKLKPDLNILNLASHNFVSKNNNTFIHSFDKQEYILKWNVAEGITVIELKNIKEKSANKLTGATPFLIRFEKGKSLILFIDDKGGLFKLKDQGVFKNPTSFEIDSKTNQFIYSNADGVYRVNPNSENSTKLFQNLSIRSIHPYDENRMIVAFVMGRFRLIDRNIENGIVNDQILITRSTNNRFIHRFPNGKLIANYADKILQLNEDDSATKLSQATKKYPIVVYDDKHLLFFKGEDINLLNVENGVSKPFAKSNSINYPISILALSDNLVAISHHNGMTIYNLEKEDDIFFDAKKGGLALYQLDDNTVLCSFEDGIIKEYTLNEESIKEARSYDIGPPVATMMSIRDNELWLGTFSGVGIMNLEDGSIRYLDNDMLSHPESNRYSIYYDSMYSKMYIGTVRGLSIIDVNKLSFAKDTAETYFVQVVYPSIIVDSTVTKNVLFEDDISISLPSSRRNCKLSFTNSDILHLSEKKYYYRINKGAWIDNGNSNQIDFSYFKSGDNVVEISCLDVMDTNPIAMLKANIYVTPYFYETWWFRGIVLFMISGLIYFWYRRIKTENIRLEQVVEERTAELRKDKDIIQKQTEDLQELDLIKNQFFTNISHELRTPLTLLLSPLDQISKKEDLTENQKYLFRLMSDNGKLLEERIDEMLELSRLESGKAKLARQAVNLKRLIDFSTRIFEQQAQQKEIHYEVIQEGTDINILTDEKRVAKIIQNLTGNALKFTDKKGMVKCRFEVKDQNLHIEIEDTGIGMTTKDSEKVFERFYQVKTEATMGNPGTGIGLAMVREYVDLLQGTINLKSEIGKGTLFNLTLPIEKSTIEDHEDEYHNIIVSDFSFVQEGSGKLPTILIVEDNDQLRGYIRSIVQDYFTVIEAENGKVALEKLKSDTTINVVLSDIMMPEMDGLSLLSQVRTNPMLKKLPFIFLTAKHNEQDIFDAYRMGVDDYIKKPFAEQALLYRLNAIYQNYLNRIEASTEEDVDMEQERSIPGESDFIRNLYELIEQNLSAHDFSTEFLADHLDISRRHLIRIVKKEIGTTPKEYIREIKLNKARRIFEEGITEDVKQVTEMVGFSTPKYFRRLYFERFGNQWGK